MPQPPKPKLADVLRLGADVAQTKASLNPKMWRSLVNAARRQGYTVSGYLSGNPNALKERLPSAIRAEAQRNVAAAYAPTYKNLSIQAKQTQAMDVKRKADNAYYQQWVQDQYSKLYQQNVASDNALVAQQQQIAQDSSQAWSAAQAGAYSAAAATPGNVSNPQSSTALAQIAPAAQKSSGVIASMRQQSADLVHAAQAQQTQGQAAAVAQAAAAEAQRQGDTWKALQDIGDARAAAKSKQGADTISELARLKGIEISNAMANRDYNAAAEKLGIASAQLRTTATRDARNFGLATAKYNLDRQTAKNKATIDALKIRMGYAKIRQQSGQAAADRELKRQLAAQNSADRAAAIRQSDINNRRSTTASGRTALTDSARARSEALYAQLTSARTKGNDFYLANKRDVNRTRAQMKAAGYSGAALNIAMDLVVRGKLTPRNVAAAKSLGLIVPPEWKP